MEFSSDLNAGYFVVFDYDLFDWAFYFDLTAQALNQLNQWLGQILDAAQHAVEVELVGVCSQRFWNAFVKGEF